MKKNFFFFSLNTNELRICYCLKYELARKMSDFCHNVVMKIEKDLSHIAEAIALANASNNAVAPQFADLLADLQGQKLAEDFTVEHGTQHASDDEVKAEFVSLDAVESDKDDIDENDENLVDMDCVSGSFADLFDTIES